MAQANLAHGPNLGPGPQFKKPCCRVCDNPCTEQYECVIICNHSSRVCSLDNTIHLIHEYN